MPDKQKPELLVDWCSYEAAKYAVEHWHYSGTMPAGKAIKIGVWESGQFIGAILFSRGANHHIGSPYGLTQAQVCELTRVALTHHRVAVSQLVSTAISMLRKHCPSMRLIVSYADPEQGHVGAIYQAGNWLYVGKSNAQRECVKNGVAVHKRTVVSVYGSIKGFAPSAIYWKHKYLYPLDKAMRRRIEPLRQPYPKRESVRLLEGPQLPAEVGGAEPTRTLQQAGE